MADKAPDVSIDEALRLFLSIAYPQGLPEGADEEQLMNLLRDKVALDRPEWGKASGHVPEEESPWLARSRGETRQVTEEICEESPEETTVADEPIIQEVAPAEAGIEEEEVNEETPEQRSPAVVEAPEQEMSASPPAPVVSERAEKASEPGRPPVAEAPDYAAIKQEIIERANQEEIPTDPEERYFYYRAKELQEAVDKKKEEEQEARVKDELRRKLLEENAGRRVPETTIEKAFRIRQVLEGKFRESLDERLMPGSAPAAGDSNSGKQKIPRPGFAKREFRNAYTEKIKPRSIAPLRTENEKEEAGGAEKPGPLGIAEESANSRTPSVGELSAEDKLASFREWNAMRKGNLKKREDLLQSRRPDNKRMAMEMDQDVEKRERRPEQKRLQTTPRGRGTALNEIRARMSAGEAKGDEADMSMRNEMGRETNRRRESLSLDDSGRSMV